MENNDILNKIDLIDDRVDVIEKQLPVFNERYKTMNNLFQKNIIVLDKLESSFQDNRLAMQALTLSVEQSNKEMAEIKNDIFALKEERSFNFIQWLKDNFISIVTLLAIAGMGIKILG